MDGIDDRGLAHAWQDAKAFILERAPLVAQVERLARLRRHDPTEWAREGVTALAGQVRADWQPPLAVALLQGGPDSADAAGPVGARLIEQEPCEEAEWFADRVAAQAVAWPDPSVLVAVPDARAAGLSLEEYSAFNVPPGGEVLYAQWYAELRSPDAAFAVAGLIDLTGDEPPEISGPLTPSEAGPLGRFLRGHPDRRRRPLDRWSGWLVTERWPDLAAGG